MKLVSVRIFASHPVAVAQFTCVLQAEKDLCLVSDEDEFLVGVFDGELASLDSVLSVSRLRFPLMRPLLVCSPCDVNECVHWLFRGVWGLVTYDRYEEELRWAVRQLAAGQLYFPAPVVTRWMRMDEAHRARGSAVGLTRRERDVMDFLLRRLSNKEIAALLRIKESTVKFHVANVFNKLNVSSRQELSGECNPDVRPT